MTTVKLQAALGLLLLTACSSGSGAIEVERVVQDLASNADGLVTRVVFDRSPGSLSPSIFRADGGQTAVALSVDGSVAHVTWDERVTPSHRVRVERSGIDGGEHAVTTSDASSPTFALTSAVQDTSDGMLGGDELTITFNGPRVVESQAEDLTRWSLRVGSAELDLSGSIFDLDPSSGVLSITLGPLANLHADFSLAALDLASVADVAVDPSPVAGVATGDTSAPGAPTVEQMLAVDAAGHVVDFVFSEPMDPVFATQLANFTLNDHPDSSELTLVTNVDQPTDGVLRVTFGNPVVPGLDTVSLTDVVDAHGNPFAGIVAIGNSSPLPNAFDAVTALTVPNEGGDGVIVTTDQAFDPDLAVDPARWTLSVDGSPIDLAEQVVSYDVATATLTIELDFDMQNGDPVLVTAVGQVDVDGEAFNGSPAFAVTAGGDSGPPTVVSVVQNRATDPSGQTVDVTFSEDLDPSTAEVPASYAFAPAVGVLSATRVSGGNVVRLATDTVLVPGDFTVTIDGTVEDLAGNAMGAAQGPLSFTSTDAAAPHVLSVTATAVEGYDDDRIAVQFDDDMVEADLDDPSSWLVESPVGTPFDVAGASVSYAPLTRIATMTLDAGSQNLKVGSGLQVSFVGARDVGGNPVDSTPVSGEVGGDDVLPEALAAWRDAVVMDELVVRFSEPCDLIDDLYDASLNPAGTRYALRDDDAGSTLRGYPVSATVLDDGLGVRLGYGFVVDLGDTVDVIGATDLAGNPMFPALGLDVEAADPSPPTHSGGALLTAVAGERNDTIEVEFATPMSPWRLLEPSNYAVSGGSPVDLEAASFAWDGNDRVLITLDGSGASDLQAGESLDVSLLVDPLQPLRTAQGVEIAAVDADSVPVGGDAAAPTQAGSRAVLDTNDPESLLVAFDEAVAESLAETPGAYDWDSGTIASSATLVGPRVVRVGFGTPLSAGTTLQVSSPAPTDLAGNDAGTLSLAVTADTSAPLVASVVGISTPGVGGDRVEIAFDEPLDLSTALNRFRYEVLNGGTVDLAHTVVTWDSTTATVVLRLASTIDLDAGQPLTVTTTGVRDVAGNQLLRVTLAGTVTGDALAPDLQAAFVNWRRDLTGRVVEVRFTEDVDEAFAADPANWTCSGGQGVVSVEAPSPDHYRLTLDAPLGAAHTVGIDGVRDMAGNLAGPITIDPQ